MTIKVKYQDCKPQAVKVTVGQERKTMEQPIAHCPYCGRYSIVSTGDGFYACTACKFQTDRDDEITSKGKSERKENTTMTTKKQSASDMLIQDIKDYLTYAEGLFNEHHALGILDELVEDAKNQWKEEKEN